MSGTAKSATGDFPIISVEHAEKNFDVIAQKIYDASHQWGFFILTDHGIQGVDGMFDLSEQFFNLPKEEKLSKIISKDNIGYDAYDPTKPIGIEGMSFGMPAGGVLTTKDLHSFFDETKRQQVEEFKSQCDNLTHYIFRCFSICMGLPEKHFGDGHQNRMPGNALKLIKYPRLDTQPDVDVPRLSEHTDWGSITLLFAKTAGLEIQTPSSWIDVPVVANGIIVNIGDALSLWTGRKLKSTLHRISWEKLPRTKDRYSIAYFVNPNKDAKLIDRIAQHNQEDVFAKLPPSLTFGDYWWTRFRLSNGSPDGEVAKRDVNKVDPELLKLLRRVGVVHDGIAFETKDVLVQ